MTTSELQQKIQQLKEENDFCVLAHVYENHEILEVADHVGDSFALSRAATRASNQNILMCGVRFMAETCKILSPDRHVFLASEEAGCPMAEQLTKDDVLRIREAHPGVPVVAYINTTAELKTVCDLVVTSSSAIELIAAMPEDEIVFIPDPKLGSWIAEKLPEKTFHFYGEGCPVHRKITVDELRAARAAHPEAEVLVHPEAGAEITALADYAGSTTGIMKQARESSATEFIIGTENNIVTHLQYEMPDKRFHVLASDCICADMRLTSLVDVYNALRFRGGSEILLSNAILRDAKRPIDRMLALSSTPSPAPTSQA